MAFAQTVKWTMIGRFDKASGRLGDRDGFIAKITIAEFVPNIFNCLAVRVEKVFLVKAVVAQVIHLKFVSGKIFCIVFLLDKCISCK